MQEVEIKKSMFNWNVWMLWVIGFVDSSGALAVITLLRKVTSLGNECQIGVGDSD